MNDNKKIAVNTIAIYVRLIITSLVGLFTSRYVLLALGHSDFGLYSVVGSTIVLINTIGIAMHTTTRRYINVEMGKGVDGNLNKIFNISLHLHVLIAIFFFVVAMIIGYWYINYFLKVDADKIQDANFVYIISTIVSCVGLINVPYQGLLNAFQKFWQLALVDIFNSFLKLATVLMLLHYDGNRLRFYAIAMSLITFISFVFYHLLCSRQWKDVVTFKYYRDKTLYKEILVFNNYTAMGALSCIGRTQGSAMVINFFFGTVVNAALAIAYQVQTYTQMFASNLAQASAPQITQAYSAGNLDRAYKLCSRVARYTILIMCCIFFPLMVGLKQILQLWLGEIPEHTLILTKWVLIVSLIDTFGANLSTYVHTFGKVKWFQLCGSIIEISLIPISVVLFLSGMPPVTIVITLAVVAIMNTLAKLILLQRLAGFPSLRYAKETYIKPFSVIIVMLLLISVAGKILEGSMSLLFIGVIMTGLTTIVLSLYVGLSTGEREPVLRWGINKVSGILTL